MSGAATTGGAEPAAGQTTALVIPALRPLQSAVLGQPSALPVIAAARRVPVVRSEAWRGLRQEVAQRQGESIHWPFSTHAGSHHSTGFCTRSRLRQITPRG
jgi:hypothetical protein